MPSVTMIYLCAFLNSVKFMEVIVIWSNFFINQVLLLHKNKNLNIITITRKCVKVCN